MLLERECVDWMELACVCVREKRAQVEFACNLRGCVIRLDVV